MPDLRLAGAGRAPLEERLQGLARHILEERNRRTWHFPRAVFGETPWEMLLLLYASESRSLPNAALLNGILVAPAVIDRWIDYLERESLLSQSEDPHGSPALHLTPGGLACLELYLRDRLQRTEGEGPGSGAGVERGLPGRAVLSLVLATAILSAAVTWWLAGA